MYGEVGGVVYFGVCAGGASHGFGAVEKYGGVEDVVFLEVFGHEVLES